MSYQIHYTQLILSILSIVYFARIANHLIKRTSWHLSPIILAPFLTSINDTSYFSFLTEPEIGEYSLDNIFKIISFWFSGTYTSLLLISLFFIAEKVSLSVLSVAALTEVWMISIGSSPLLIKSIGFTNALPFIASIFIALIIHTLKRKKEISLIIKDSPLFINSKTLSFCLDNKNVIMGIIFLLVISTFFFNNPDITLAVISNSHIIRIISFWSLFILMLLFFQSFNYKRVISFLPVLIIYLGLSFTGNSTVVSSNVNPASLDCMTSIAVLPLLEYLSSLYYGLNTRLKFGLITITSKALKFILKACYIVLVSTFTLYLLS